MNTDEEGYGPHLLDTRKLGNEELLLLSQASGVSAALAAALNEDLTAETGGHLAGTGELSKWVLACEVAIAKTAPKSGVNGYHLAQLGADIRVLEASLRLVRSYNRATELRIERDGGRRPHLRVVK